MDKLTKFIFWSPIIYGDWAIFTTTLLYQLPTADFFLKMKEQASIKLIVPVPLVFVEI